jgi:TATA-binding protein-associated factor Taf7
VLGLWRPVAAHARDQTNDQDNEDDQQDDPQDAFHEKSPTTKQEEQDEDNENQRHAISLSDTVTNRARMMHAARIIAIETFSLIGTTPRPFKG